MMPKGKAHCYDVWPNEGNSEQVLTVLRSFVKRPFLVEFDQSGHRVCVCEERLRTANKRQEIFTASAFRVRKKAFPSVVGPSGVDRLRIPDDTDLGEPTCFAFDPIAGKAAVYYTQNGPRSGVIREFLNEIGFPHEMSIEPVLRTDMRERLERTRFVQSLQFKIKDALGADHLRNAGVPVEKAIDIVGAVGGTDISVDVSISRSDSGLALSVVKRVARHLERVGDTHVQRLVLNAAEEEDAKCQKLDLLNARVEFTLDVADDDRQLDRSDCQQQLVEVLKEMLPGIAKKIT
jgi:hypothetical protein